MYLHIVPADGHLPTGRGKTLGKPAVFGGGIPTVSAESRWEIEPFSPKWGPGWHPSASRRYTMIWKKNVPDRGAANEKP